MPPRDPQVILQKLGQTTLKIDSFFLRRTGFIANQTVLKLGEYNVNCVPATIGISEARFLAALTPSEIGLFSRYKEGTHILILTFDKHDTKDIARFPLRVGLVDIITVPDRKNVCFLLLKLKSMPAELVLFLGAFMDELEERLRLWDALATEEFAFTPDLVLSSGFGYGAVLCRAVERVSVEIVSFHTKRICFQQAESTPPLEAGPGAQLRVVFQGRSLTLEGTVEGATFVPEFNPDWLDFVEEVQFHLQLKNRGKPGKAS